jgi:hypothetical protein
LACRATGLRKLPELAVSSPYPNPRQITEEGISQLLERAFAGLPPLAS